MAHQSFQELEDEALNLPLEAERRAEAMRSGRVRSEPVKEALARVRAKLA